MPVGPRWKQNADECSSSLGTVEYSPVFAAHAPWGGGRVERMGFYSPDVGLGASLGWVALTLSRPSSELPLHNLLFPPFPAGPLPWDPVAGQ